MSLRDIFSPLQARSREETKGLLEARVNWGQLGQTESVEKGRDYEDSCGVLALESEPWNANA
jgi:hypothetical protein